MNRCLTKIGFVKCPFEHAIYVRRDGNEALIVGVYFDDLLVTGTAVENIERFKEQMEKQFEMSNLGRLTYYIGIEVDQRSDCIELKQTAYAKKLLERAGMAECNPIKYLMGPKAQLHKNENGKLVNPTVFKSIIGGLRYFIYIRPNISYSVGVVSRFMERPTMLHLNDAKRILRYIKGTLSYGLIYMKGHGDYMLAGFSDSDLAGNIQDRKSTRGMAFYLD